MATSLSISATRHASGSSLALLIRPNPWMSTGQILAGRCVLLPPLQRTIGTMTTASPPVFQSIQNFRDVASSSPDTIKPGLLFRTARLDTASTADWQTLRGTCGIKSTIDLRSEDEQKAAPPPEASVEHHSININGSSYARALISHLSVLDQARLLFHAATGRRQSAIRILGTGAMTPRGLVGLATDTLDASGAEIKQVFAVLSKKQNYPIAVYCHQGKDRTGIITALVLLLCRVDVAAVQQDYDASTGAAGMTGQEKEERIKELANMGLPATFAGTDANFVRGVVDHCEAKYGGVDGYLGHIGVDADMRRAVQKVLLR